LPKNDPDEQQKYLRYNDLLASAVILQNVIDMSQIIADLRRWHARLQRSHDREGVLYQPRY
jgi:hypothetical protein